MFQINGNLDLSTFSGSKMILEHTNKSMIYEKALVDLLTSANPPLVDLVH